MSGFISPKRAVKSRMDSRIFSDFNCGILSLVEEVFCSALIAPGVHINFAAKRKIGSIIGGLRQIGWSVWRSNLFSSLIWTLL